MEVAGPRQQVWPLCHINCSQEGLQGNNKPGTSWEAAMKTVCSSMGGDHPRPDSGVLWTEQGWRTCCCHLESHFRGVKQCWAQGTIHRPKGHLVVTVW